MIPTQRVPAADSSKTRRVIEFAIEAARQFGHTTVTPEHVLLGLLTDETSLALSALAELGVAPDWLRQAVVAEAGW